MTAYALETMIGAGLLSAGGLGLVAGLIVAMVKGGQR